MLAFQTLGTLDLADPERTRPLDSLRPRPKLLGLFAYLVLRRPAGFQQRETLIGVFWPDRNQRKARHSLRQALHEIRSAVGDGVVTLRGDEVAIERGSMECDAWAYLDAVEAGDTDRALDLYRGELLEGFYVSGCPEFERWLDKERRRLASLAVGLAKDASRARAEMGDTAGAVAYLRRALGWAPYDESLFRPLLDHLIEAGERAAAVREYDIFAARLARDLGVRPSDDIAAMVDETRDHDGAAQAALEAEAVVTTSIGAGIGEPGAQRPQRGWWTPTRGLVATSIFLAGLAATVLYRPEPAPESDRVLVLPFANATADSSLDRLGPMAADWIAQGIAETGLVEAVSGSVSSNTVDLGNFDDIRAESERSRASIVVHGSYYMQRDSLVFETRVVDGRSGDVQQADIVSVPAGLPLVAVEELRRRTMGTLATLYDPRLNSWVHVAGTPPDYEAYLLYSEGMEALQDGRRVSSLVSPGSASWQGSIRTAAEKFEQAATVDSTFYVALLRAVHARLLARDRDRADSLLDVLSESRERLTRWERTLLDAMIASRNRDWPAEYRAYTRLSELTPDSEWIFGRADAAYKLGRFEETVELLTRREVEDSWLEGWEAFWERRAVARHLLGDHEAELDDAREGRREVPGSTRLRLAEIRAGAALGIDALGPVDSNEAFAMVEELRRHGHMELAEKAVARHMTDYDVVRDSVYANASYWLERSGRTAEATALLEDVVAKDPSDTWALARLGELAAKSGDRGAAIAYSTAITEVTPEPDAGLAAYYQARILANLGDNEQALRLLEAARSRGWSRSAMWFHVTPYLPQTLRDYPQFQDYVARTTR